MNAAAFHPPMVIETVEHAVVMVDRAYVALCEAEHFQQTREIRNVAIAAAAYAREAKDTRLIDKATELRTRAERKAGQMLREAAEQGERAKPGSFNGNQHVASSHESTTLAQIGVTRDQSSKWQQTAKLTDAEFERALELTKAVTHEISSAKVLKVAREAEDANARFAGMPRFVKMPEPTRTPEQQAVDLYNALESLDAITCTVAQLREALPFYQHFRIAERLPRSLALLQEVERSWKTT